MATGLEPTAVAFPTRPVAKVMGVTVLVPSFVAYPVLPSEVTTMSSVPAPRPTLMGASGLPSVRSIGKTEPTPGVLPSSSAFVTYAVKPLPLEAMDGALDQPASTAKASNPPATRARRLILDRSRRLDFGSMVRRLVDTHSGWAPAGTSGQAGATSASGPQRWRRGSNPRLRSRRLLVGTEARRLPRRRGTMAIVPADEARSSPRSRKAASIPRGSLQAAVRRGGEP